jgi:hypothetical protein
VSEGSKIKSGIEVSRNNLYKEQSQQTVHKRLNKELFPKQLQRVILLTSNLALSLVQVGWI